MRNDVKCRHLAIMWYQKLRHPNVSAAGCHKWHQLPQRYLPQNMWNYWRRSGFSLKRVGRTEDKGVSQNEGISNQKVMQPN